jgi:hypothetical protein
VEIQEGDQQPAIRRLSRIYDTFLRPGAEKEINVSMATMVRDLR